MINKLIKTFKAVLWGFLGIRSWDEFEIDRVELKPLYLIVVGIFIIIIFVVTLMMLVKYIAR